MIAVKDLKFTYPKNKVETLHGLNFEIGEGEIFGFLGPSGAGKSTTQKILFGLLKDFSGDVRVMNKGINQWGQELYTRIGISFETPNHYESLTALENLEYFQTLYRETHDLQELLDWVGLAADGDKRVSQFSKGMKVRLNVARAMLHKPRILFLDEPTMGLDPANARNIKDLVLRLRQQGTTVFITTHNMMVADELCDRVAFITGGELRIIETPATLKRQYGKRNVNVHYLDGEERVASFPLAGLGKNRAFLDLLNSGKRIEALHSQEATLESIFIEVTGQELQV